MRVPEVQPYEMVMERTLVNQTRSSEWDGTHLTGTPPWHPLNGQATPPYKPLSTVKGRAFSLEDINNNTYDFVKPYHAGLEHDRNFIVSFKQKKPTHMYRTDDYYFHTRKDIDHHEAKHAEYVHNMQEVVAYDRENKAAYFRWLAVNQRAKFTDKRLQNHAKNTSQYNTQRWAVAGGQATQPFFHSVQYLNERDSSIVVPKGIEPQHLASAPRPATVDPQASMDRGTRSCMGSMGRGMTTMSSTGQWDPTASLQSVTREAFGPRPRTSAQSSRGTISRGAPRYSDTGMTPPLIAARAAACATPVAAPPSPRTRHRAIASVKELELFETRLNFINTIPKEERLRQQLEQMELKQRRPKTTPLRHRLEQAKIVNPRPQTVTNQAVMQSLTGPGSLYGSRTLTPVRGLRVQAYMRERTREA